MNREKIKATTRRRHEQAIASLPESIKESCRIETREQVLKGRRFRVHSYLRDKNNQEIGQIETNADLKESIIRETLVSYEYLP